MDFLSFNSDEKTPLEIQKYLQGSVIPRPIGFASTVDIYGNVNLSPFSFFNCFGSNPPLLVFSPARRGRDNTIKHTLENLKEVPEVVIGIVGYDIVEQMSLSSSEYPKGVNEFIKSGLTELKSDIIKPPRVAECKVSFECEVMQIIETGERGGAGNLVICEIRKFHLDNEIIDKNGNIDPLKLDPVARLGGNSYLKVTPHNIFEIRKPLQQPGVGVDKIPDKIIKTGQLSGNELGKLGNAKGLPKVDTGEELIVNHYKEKIERLNEAEKLTYIINGIKELLRQDNVDDAWLLISIIM